MALLTHMFGFYLVHNFGTWIGDEAEAYTGSGQAKQDNGIQWSVEDPCNSDCHAREGHPDQAGENECGKGSDRVNQEINKWYPCQNTDD